MALSMSHVQVSCTTCSCPVFLCQTYPGSCCELSQQGAAPALPSTLIPAGLVEFGPFEASLSLGAAHVTLQGGMEVPWATHSQKTFGSPLAPLEAQVTLEPCPPGAQGPSVLPQAGCALCGHGSPAFCPAVHPPQLQMALQGLLLSLQGRTGKGGSWGWFCPAVTGMLAGHLGWAVQRLLPRQPRGAEGLGAGVCSTSPGKQHHLPELQPGSWGTPLLLGLGKAQLAAIPNPPATAAKTNPEVRFPSLPGVFQHGKEGWLRPEESPPHARDLDAHTGQGMGVRVPSSCVSGWRPQQDFSKGMLPEGILCGHRLVCQHCTLLGARANAPARFVPRLGGPVHSRPLLCTRHESWEGTRGGPGCQTIPPAQHPHQGSTPVPLLSTVTPVSPHTPGKLPYLRGAELGHADHWFVPKAAAKHWQSRVQVRRVAHGGRGTRGMWHTGDLDVPLSRTLHPSDRAGVSLGLTVRAAPPGLGSRKGLRACAASRRG